MSMSEETNLNLELKPEHAFGGVRFGILVSDLILLSGRVNVINECDCI